MNDASMSADLVAYEREHEKEALRARARELTLAGQTPGRPRGVLSAEEAAARQALQATAMSAQDTSSSPGEHSAPEEGVAVRTIPAGKAAEDPLVALHHARLGVVAAVALAVLLLWMRRRVRS